MTAATTLDVMGRIRVRLPVVLAEHRIKQTQLAEISGIRNATLNAMYNEKAQRVEYDNLVKIIEGIRTLTGRTYSVGDLLEYVEDAPAAPVSSDN